MNCFTTNPDGTTKTVDNISMNLVPGRKGNSYKNHVAEKIYTKIDLIKFAEHCENMGYSVMDKSDAEVFPKCICVPDVEKLGEGDLIRVYNTTNYPVHTTCIDWKKSEPAESFYKISESALDQLLSDLGEFVNRDSVRGRFELV